MSAHAQILRLSGGDVGVSGTHRVVRSRLPHSQGAEATEKKPELGPTILVPVDFSEHSRAALLFACQQALSLGGSVVVLHVVHDPAEAPGFYAKEAAEGMESMEEVAEKMMRGFLDIVGREVRNRTYFETRLEAKLVTGLPVTRILEVAEMTGAALIIMGSHGRKGLKRLMLGSKAEQVAREAPMPVTIVKGAA